MTNEFIKTLLDTNAAWLAASYCGVIVAMTADLLSGLRKSRRLGIPRNSRSYKRSCDKAMKYFLPMICLSCIDIIASPFMPGPAMTMIYGAYCIFCELKSIMETTVEKEHINRGIDIVRSSVNGSTDLRSLLKNLILEILDESRKEELK